MEKDSKQFLIQGDVYEVEKLVGIKIVKGKKLYRVRWRGYGKESDTLEPEENLLSCKDMILELEEKMSKRRNKREYKGQNLVSKSSMEDISKYSSNVTWQASEVQPGPSLKDTFWRDFDEGKINIPDQDMYSKVKERASRTLIISDNSKSPEFGQKENPLPPLCPKVVLKRKPISRSNESLAYRSSLKKPISLHVKKRKKYDILRDYRRRKSRVHRKRNANENHQSKSSYRMSEKSDNFNSENGLNILQELLINDDMQSSMHTNVGGAQINQESISSTVPKSRDAHRKSKDFYCEENADTKKNQPLMCRITIHDKSKSLYSSFKHSIKKSIDSSTIHKNSVSESQHYNTKKTFYALLDAAVNEELEKVEKYSSNLSAINCSQEDGTTVLMVAAKLGLYNVAKILLRANAHKDKQNKKGETALMLACRNKHPKIAKLLLEHGANFAITNADGVNVLRITNQHASKTILHNILVEHIMRIVSEFEQRARTVIEHIAEIKYALFPIQCFSLNEGPKYSINFHHHVKLESPGKSGKQNLLFIANSTIKGNSILCVFDADPVVRQVSINGVKQELFQKGEYSVYKMSGLQNGNNKVFITTHHYPESEVKLIVCAYRVHRSIAWFPAQKLKNEFVD